MVVDYVVIVVDVGDVNVVVNCLLFSGFLFSFGWIMVSCRKSVYKW